MKIRTKKLMLIPVLCASLLCGGCEVAGRKVIFTTGLGNKDVFRIGETVCTLPEAKVYLCNYQNIYGSVYGLNLWEQASSKKQLDSYVKEMTISELARITCMDQLAEEQDISLSEEEQRKAAEAAKAYFSSLSKDEIAYMDVTEETIETLYQNYALADKLYATLTEGVNEEVSDDEARIIHAMQIVVKDKENADAVTARLAAGEDFTSLASDYNEGQDIEVTFGRGDVPEEVEKVAFSMEDVDGSSWIHTDQGYYFIKCVNKYDEELTQENKVKIAQEREKTAFNDAYDAFVKEQDSMLNEKLWDETKIVTDGSITTNSFFAVYAQYCK